MSNATVQVAQALKVAGKPTFLYGAGRFANVTLFGATGFLGRYVASRLGQLNTRCNMPNRGDELEVRHLKPMFALGNTHFPMYNIRDEESVRKAIGNSDIVINLVGKFYETKGLVRTRQPDGSKSRVNFSFEEIHEEWPAKLGRLCHDMGVKQMIHVSALGADPESSSRWYKSKAAGEKAVRAAFQDAIIVRPASMFGDEDRLLNWMAQMGSNFGFVPLLDGGERLLQPVWVQDVAEAIVACIDNDWQDDRLRPDGHTVELAGPAEYTWRELHDFVEDVTGRGHPAVSVPARLAQPVGAIFERLPVLNVRGPLYTLEDAVQQQLDVVATEDPSVLRFDHFDMKPTRIEDVAFNYLYRYRKGGHFTKAKGYH